MAGNGVGEFLASRPISWSTVAWNEKELTMKSRAISFDRRRILLSFLAMLPVLPGLLRLTPAHARAQRDPLPSRRSYLSGGAY